MIRRSTARYATRKLSRALFMWMLLAVAVVVLHQMGWLTPVQGLFTAVDGDSLRKGKANYRLHGIDAPELHQTCRNANGKDYPCGQEARDALRRLVSGKTLDCVTFDTDRYGRNVVSCTSGAQDINAEMVRQGWAIAYRKHSQSYTDMEDEAQRAQRGIWQGHFENPEDWREQHRGSLVRGELTEDEAMQD